MACRSMMKCNEAADNIRRNSTNGQVVPMELDLASLKSVENFSTELKKKFQRLDHVIFNAGMTDIAFVMSADGFENIFASNHLGHFKLYLDLENLIEESSKKFGTVTISHVTSSQHFLATRLFHNLDSVNNASNFDLGRYPEAKLANILFSNELARKFSENKWNVLSNAVNPGLVRTNFAADAARGATGWFKIRLSLFLSVKEATAWDPNEASLTQLYTTVSKKITEEKINGKYFHPITNEVKPHTLATPENSRKLWNFSLELLHSKGYNLNNKAG